MPIIRCKEFDDDGKPLKPFGCPRGKSCKFVHPDSGYWATAPRNDPGSRRSFQFPDRGRGRGRGGPLTGPRDRTGSNTTPLGPSGGASGWGPKVTVPTVTTWGTGWGSSTEKGRKKEKDKDEGNPSLSAGWGSGWGTSWDPANNTKKGDSASIDKGKGIATEPSFGEWANEAAKNDDISWGDWGSTGEWPAASPKETKSGSTIFEPPDNPGSSKRSTVSPVSDRRPISETMTPDHRTKRVRPENLRLSSVEFSSKAETDSPRSSVAPPSAVSWRDSKPLVSPDVHNHPTFILRQSSTPDMSEHSSRAGSIVPFGSVPRPKEIRNLRSVSFKDARNIWNEYVDLIRRPISLGLFLTQERANYKVYKTAQNSPIYTKVGRGGTNLLDESARRFRARLDREEKAYREAVDRLCAFEEGFDFVIHALAGRFVDKSKMREELAGLKSYMDDTTACVGGMQATGDDIETKAHAAIKPALPVAKEEKEEEKEDVELQTPPKSQDQDIDERLLALKEKSLELCGELLNPRGNAGASDAIKEQVEGKKPALLELLGSEEEFSAKVTKISGEQASLGRDLEAVCDELAQILESLGKAEICVQEEIDRLKQSLEEDQQLFEASEVQVRECQDILVKSVGSLSLLRQGIQALEEQHRTPSFPSGLSEGLIDQLATSLLPIIREELYPDVESALQLLTSNAVDAFRERESPLRTLTTILASVYKTTGPNSKLETKRKNGKAQLTASPRTGDAKLHT